MSDILLIDDEELVRVSLGAVLASAGHRVALAGDGEDGLRLYEAGRFDLVVTDIVMPGREGIETIRALRRGGRPVKILAISGGARAGSGFYLTAARALGADDALLKPFTPAELRSAVARLISADQQGDREHDRGGLERPDPALRVHQQDQRRGANHQRGIVRPYFEAAPHASLLPRNDARLQGGDSAALPRIGLGQHRSEQRAVDIAAALDRGDTTAAEPVALLQRRGQRGGAGAFREVVRVGEEDAHRLADLGFADGHDAGGAAPDDVERRGIGHAAGEPVGDRVGAVRAHRRTGRE